MFSTFEPFIHFNKTTIMAIHVIEVLGPGNTPGDCVTLKVANTRVFINIPEIV